MASSSNTFMWDWSFHLLAITVFHLQNRPSKLCLEIFRGLNKSPVTSRTSEPLPVHLAMIRLTSCSAGLHASSSVLPPRTLLTIHDSQVVDQATSNFARPDRSAKITPVMGQMRQQHRHIHALVCVSDDACSNCEGEIRLVLGGRRLHRRQRMVRLVVVEALTFPNRRQGEAAIGSSNQVHRKKVVRSTRVTR